MVREHVHTPSDHRFNATEIGIFISPTVRDSGLSVASKARSNKAALEGAGLLMAPEEVRRR